MSKKKKKNRATDVPVDLPVQNRRTTQHKRVGGVGFGSDFDFDFDFGSDDLFRFQVLSNRREDEKRSFLETTIFLLGRSWRKCTGCSNCIIYSYSIVIRVGIYI